MASEVATMQPTIRPRPAARESAASARASGRPPGALVALQRPILAGRQRLFDQHDAQAGQVRRQAAQLVEGQGLVGVDDQARAGRGLAHRRHGVQVVAGADLQLQHGPARIGAGGLRHLLHRAQADRETGLHRVEPGAAGQGPGADPGALGLQVPERAIERVARRARRQQALEFGTAGPSLDPVSRSFNLRQHACDRLAIAGIGHGLAATAIGSGDDFGDHHFGLGLGASGYDEGPRQRPAFDPGGQVRHA